MTKKSFTYISAMAVANIFSMHFTLITYIQLFLILINRLKRNPELVNLFQQGDGGLGRMREINIIHTRMKHTRRLKSLYFMWGSVAGVYRVQAKNYSH